MDYYSVFLNQVWAIPFQIPSYTSETYNGLKVGLTRASFQHTTVACASIWLGKLLLTSASDVEVDDCDEVEVEHCE